MKILYLHGFASSPGSKKANFFREPLETQLNATYHIPDLNAPSFEQLMLTAMLERVASTIRSLDDDDVALIGSSMGGLTALHFYDRYRHAEALRVKRLVLLAPALDFVENRSQQLGDDWASHWQEQGTLPFFNYASNSECHVHFGLVKDIQQYDSYTVQIDIPTLIYHGIHDASVNYEQSKRFAKNRDLVTLHLLDSDHQLLDKTDEILAGIVAFLKS